MPILTIYACDFCGAQKQETNHWYVTRESIQDGTHHFEVCEFTEERPYKWGVDVQLACGENCVGVALSRFLNGAREGAGR